LLDPEERLANWRAQMTPEERAEMQPHRWAARQFGAQQHSGVVQQVTNTGKTLVLPILTPIGNRDKLLWFNDRGIK